MIRTILIGLLAVGLVGTGYWGYTEHQEKNSILINAENNYQRAFHQLTYHIDQLNDEIGTVLAMNSQKQLSPSLAEIWRITSQARSEVGQLPLTLMPFNKTEEFLSNIGDYSYRVAVRDLNKEPLSKEEIDTLQTLYKNASDIKHELRKVQSLVLENNLRWMDVELALASEKEPLDNTIIDGFKTVEKNVEGYSEVSWGADMDQQHKQASQLYKNITGEEISKEKAEQIGKEFLQVKEDVSVEINETGNDSDYAAYNLTVTNDQDHSIYIDISKKGGHPLWMLNSRDVKERKIGLNQASEHAEQFLEKQGFTNMSLTESSQYDNVGVFTYVHTQDDIRMYPDAITLKIALDDGSIVGFESMNYLTSHTARNIPKPKVSQSEAEKEINPNIDIQENYLAIIENDIGKEVLVHEFLGTMNDDTYRIFINAMTGEEEKVEKLKEAEPLYNQL